MKTIVDKNPKIERIKWSMFRLRADKAYSVLIITQNTDLAILKFERSMNPNEKIERKFVNGIINTYLCKNICYDVIFAILTEVNHVHERNLNKYDIYINHTNLSMKGYSRVFNGNMIRWTIDRFKS